MWYPFDLADTIKEYIVWLAYTTEECDVHLT